MANKGQNRYTLVQYVCEEKRNINNKEQVSILFEHIDEYNKKKSNPYYLGDIRVNKALHIITFKKYLKVSNASTLEKIDLMSTIYQDEMELSKYYAKNNSPFYIAYKVNKRLKLLPVIYNKDKKYINRNYVKYAYINSCDGNLVSSIIQSKDVNIEYISAFGLYEIREKLKMNKSVNISSLIYFYNYYVSKGGKFNYFNFRTLGLILREYENKNIELKNYIQCEDGQMQLESYNIGSMTSLYEDMKLGYKKYPF